MRFPLLPNFAFVQRGFRTLEKTLGVHFPAWTVKDDYRRIHEKIDRRVIYVWIHSTLSSSVSASKSLTNLNFCLHLPNESRHLHLQHLRMQEKQ